MRRAAAFVIVVGLLLCGVVGLVAADPTPANQTSADQTSGAHSASTVDPGPVRYHDGFLPGPLHEPSSAASRRALSRAERLVDADDAQLGGAYVDDSDHVVVVATSSTGRRLAERRFAASPIVEIVDGPLSLRRAGRLGDRLVAAGGPTAAIIYSWGLYEENDSLLLGVDVEPTDADRERLLGYARAHRIDIDVYVDTDVDRGGTD